MSEATSIPSSAASAMRDAPVLSATPRSCFASRQDGARRCGSEATSAATPKRGMGAGVRAAAGLFEPGTRRVIVKARYTRIVAGELGAARAHLRYIQRDGVTREGEPGRLYDAAGDDADGPAFLDRSEHDPHQFRFIVSAEDSDAWPTSSPSSAISCSRWSATSAPSSTGSRSIISTPASPHPRRRARPGR